MESWNPLMKLSGEFSSGSWTGPASGFGQVIGFPSCFSSWACASVILRRASVYWTAKIRNRGKVKVKGNTLVATENQPFQVILMFSHRISPDFGLGIEYAGVRI